MIATSEISFQAPLRDRSPRPAWIIDDEGERSRALAALAPYAPDQKHDLLSKALAPAKSIDGAYETASSSPTTPQVQVFTLGVPRTTRRGGALAALAPHLGPDQLGEALAAAENIDSETDRSHALAELAPYLTPHQL